MFDPLKSNEVLVFGSNGTGFHGAGGAGFACRGTAANTWRSDAWFQKAMKTPEGSPDRRGLYAVYGVSRGFQEGREGRSYAVQTVTRPGARQSISRREIYFQLVELWAFVAAHPEWTFLITPLGEGYAGYSRAEMQEVWDFLIKTHGARENVTWLRKEVNS